ncbi:DNA topoisomerase II [Rhizophagus clarus]|uniref:DNA topoisomerase 2 n=2 Tax=Rhizophagus clarus TaxID=94130 RepID=A0A8H3LSW0_9GLOM|nr:DNA topoisomerase II [Rhizophagus clarus]
MSDSEYTPGNEEYAVKTKKTRKLAKPMTKESFSEEEKYTIKATRTRKPTKPATLRDASNITTLESSDEEKYTVKATKSRQQPKQTTQVTLKDTSVTDVLEIDHSSNEVVKPKSRKKAKKSTLSALKDSSSALESSDKEKYIVRPTKSRRQPKQTIQTTLMNLEDTSDILEIDYSPDEEKYNVKPKSRKKAKKSILSTLKDSSNALNFSDEEKYIVKPAKSRQQPKQATRTTLKDTIDVLDTDHSSDEENVKPKSRKQPKQSTLSTLEDTLNALDSLDEEKYIVKPTKSRQKSKQTTLDHDYSFDEEEHIVKATNTRKPSSKTSSNKESSSKASSSKVDKVASKKPVEEVYQKKTQLEHILLRPDTYVGSVQKFTEKLWVYDSDKRAMVYRDVAYVPGLYKIIDEILVNAADNKIRDPTMDTIKVDIDVKSGTISIYNNGNGIPVEIHKEENVYVPELIFGHLLTSSNYNDNEKKVTGGRNGYGAKLTNIFSTEFIVETADSSAGKKYRQIFRDNMSVKESPKISSYSKKEEYTMVTFRPDFQRFNMPNEFDDDIIALLKKRVYDLAGCVKNVKVFLNGERLKIKNFKEYALMYLSGNDDFVDLQSSIIYEEVNQRWEIAFVPSLEGSFRHISFVNSINTTNGSTHVNYIADQIVEKLMAVVTKKAKDAKNIKKNQIKNHMWLFIDCLIENATFDSQTKEHLTLKVSSFGSKYNPSETYYNKLLKSSVIGSILDDVKHKQSKELKKTDGKKIGRIVGIAKLDDANNAGVERANYGIFPLRGKLLNQIFGLKQGKVYNSTDELRYGHLMIMTDQDHDGSHIKGLIINFLDYFFPSLLKVPGFLMEFVTPIVKCIRGSTKKSFFTIPEFTSWMENNDNGKGRKIKYYKGLGTSTSAEAKDYFGDLKTHRKPFKAIQEGERELIDMAFNKKKADDRKEWLKSYEPGTYMNHSVKETTIKDFINKELILFSRADNERSIPNNEIKVSSLAGAVLTDAAYHHGDFSLQGTIITMGLCWFKQHQRSLRSGSIWYKKSRRLIFHPQDDILLTYWGIGTGYSTYIPNYNPQDIVNNLKLMMDGENPVPMKPWYRDFQGRIEQTDKDKYKVCGTIESLNNGSNVRITELPIRVWTQNYKEQVEQWISGTEKVPAWIIGYKENHSTTNVDFTIHLTEEELNNALEEGLEKKFKLITSINTSNMVCFDGNGRIKKYNSAEEILLEFYDYRLEYYRKRKDHMLKVLALEVNQLRNKARFIQMKIDHNLEFEGLRKAEIIKLLESEGFERFGHGKEEKSDDEDQTGNDGDGYNYLMNTKSWSFCKEEAQKLMNKKAEKEKELIVLQKKTPQEIWKEDLDTFLDE